MRSCWFQAGGGGGGIWGRVALWLAAALAPLAALPAAQASIFLPDLGGTVPMGDVLNNPLGGGLYSRPLVIPILLDGLPPGTQVIGSINLRDYVLLDSTPGGPLGGLVENFASNMRVQMFGTATMAGWQRDITIPNVLSQVQSGPRLPGTPPSPSSRRAGGPLTASSTSLTESTSLEGPAASSPGCLAPRPPPSASGRANG